MINVKTMMQEHDVDTSSRGRAIRTIREFIEQAAEDKQCMVAQEFFYNVFTVRVEFTDRVVARLAAQYIVDKVAENNYDVGNSPAEVERAIQYANAFKNNPNNAWMFATSESSSSFKTESDAPKAPKKNKGTAALELYDVHVKNAEKPLTNGEFVLLLVKELGMTKSGARTYAYNCFKQGKEPA